MFQKIRQKLKTYNLEILLSLFFVISHLPGLGHEIFNTDVWKWKARSYDFGQGVFTLDFEKTIQKYHPGVTLMWVGVGAIKAYNLYYDVFFNHPPIDNSVDTIFELHFTQKLFLVIAVALVLGFIFHVIREHFGKRLCIIFGFLLILEPFYYALTRVFHLEGLMSTLMLASFLWYYHYLQDRKLPRLILSALFGGLAVLTKTSALYILPFVILLNFLDNLLQQPFSITAVFRKDFLLNTLKPLIIWVAIFCFTFVFFWPAMWTMPKQALEAVYRGISTIGVERGHEQFYFNQFTLDPGISYYFVVLLLKSSPFLLLGFLGSFICFRSFDKKTKTFLLYSLLFSLFYFLEITLPSKKLDRYILPSMLGLILFGSFFYVCLLSKLGKRKGVITLGLILVISSLNIFLLKLDYFSYFNPLFGGLRKGIFILEPKWMIGQHEITKYFAQKSENLVIAFPEKYYTQIYPFIQEINHEPVIEARTSDILRSDYVVYPVWEDTSSSESRLLIEYVDSIYLRGVEVYRIYAPADKK